RRRVDGDSADLQLTLRHERRGVEARRRRPGDGKGFAGIGRQRGFDRGFEAGARMTRLVMGDLTIYVENLIRGGNWPFPLLRFWQQRSEDHTSELQSRGHLVCRLLLEKKKNRETYEHPNWIPG